MTWKRGSFCVLEAVRRSSHRHAESKPEAPRDAGPTARQNPIACDTCSRDSRFLKKRDVLGEDVSDEIWGPW